MRQFEPNPKIISAIKHLDNYPFKITQLRDAYAEIIETKKSDSDLRRWLHGAMPTMVKHGFLEKVSVKGANAIHYRPTIKIINTPNNSMAPKDPMVYEENIAYLKKRLQKWQREILVTLGALEEIEDIRKERDDIGNILDERYSMFIERSRRTYGKIELLEEVLSSKL